MKKVLWVSRHEMTAEQKADLDRIMGGEARLLPWKETVRDIQALTPLLRQADAVAAVLPLELLSQLLELSEGKPVLRAVCDREMTGRTILTPDGRQELDVHYVHRCWQRLLRVEVETEDL